MQHGGQKMVSTRIASPISPMGFAEPGRRNRVDPVKLLDLIHRIKTASHEASAPVMRQHPKPVAKAG